MKNRMLTYRPLNTDLGILLLRLLLGGLFVLFGYKKIIGFDQVYPTIIDFTWMGQKVSLVATIIIELVGGFLVLIGLYTRLACIPIIFIMALCFFISHGDPSFAARTPALIYMIISIAIYFLGSGQFSVDKMVSKK